MSTATPSNPEFFIAPPEQLAASSKLSAVVITMGIPHSRDLDPQKYTAWVSIRHHRGWSFSVDFVFRSFGEWRPEPSSAIPQSSEKKGKSKTAARAKAAVKNAAMKAARWTPHKSTATATAGAAVASCSASAAGFGATANALATAGSTLTASASAATTADPAAAATPTDKASSSNQPSQQEDLFSAEHPELRLPSRVFGR
ncbi:hypothetical protein B0H63DRAFT_453963 [Podospora didyma]|uniref:Uncharacterized protein n=1 Tax=Podospora didyma TaxID=330526 RepID=A0AAE0N6M7_9PEZI|nr:hypothetical protein B0H63DRAFT_453963 [Podospora didyma]